MPDLIRKRPGIAGQTVLSGRASMAITQGAVPIATTDLPDGKWVIVDHSEPRDYTDEHGTRRHYSTTTKYLMVGIERIRTEIDAIVDGAVDRHLGWVLRYLEHRAPDRWKQVCREIGRPTHNPTSEITGRDLYEHLCLQRRALFGGWTNTPAEPAWLTALRASNPDILDAADAGSTITVGKGGRARG